MDKYSFYCLRGILLPLLFEICTGAGLLNGFQVQSSNSNTKVSRVHVLSLSEGPTRGLGIHLTSQSMHFEYQNSSTQPFLAETMFSAQCAV